MRKPNNKYGDIHILNLNTNETITVKKLKDAAKIINRSIETVKRVIFSKRITAVHFKITCSGKLDETRAQEYLTRNKQSKKENKARLRKDPNYLEYLREYQAKLYKKYSLNEDFRIKNQARSILSNAGLKSNDDKKLLNALFTLKKLQLQCQS